MDVDILFEYLEKYRDEEDELCRRAIRTGNNIDPNFWNNLLSVFNNKRAIASLFNVSPEKVSSWSSRINKYLHLVEKETKSEKKKILKTGGLS
jgi:hypothetical protein